MCAPVERIHLANKQKADQKKHTPDTLCTTSQGSSSFQVQKPMLEKGSTCKESVDQLINFNLHVPCFSIKGFSLFTLTCISSSFCYLKMLGVLYVKVKKKLILEGIYRQIIRVREREREKGGVLEWAFFKDKTPLEEKSKAIKCPIQLRLWFYHMIVIVVLLKYL